MCKTFLPNDRLAATSKDDDSAPLRVGSLFHSLHATDIRPTDAIMWHSHDKQTTPYRTKSITKAKRREKDSDVNRMLLVVSGDDVSRVSDHTHVIVPFLEREINQKISSLALDSVRRGVVDLPMMTQSV